MRRRAMAQPENEVILLVQWYRASRIGGIGLTVHRNFGYRARLQKKIF